MASANNDKGKKFLEEDHNDPKLKERQMAGGSRAREPTFQRKPFGSPMSFALNTES
jgi:hypothetical protein